VQRIRRTPIRHALYEIGAYEMHARETHTREICAHKVHELGRCGGIFSAYRRCSCHYFQVKSSVKSVTEPWGVMISRGVRRIMAAQSLGDGNPDHAILAEVIQLSKDKFERARERIFSLVWQDVLFS
jgi:hypothetical protein